jgi:hypothetical protein
MNDELERIWKAVVLALFRYYPRIRLGAEENYEISVRMVNSQPRFEQPIFRLQVYSVTARPTCPV